jgi:hypothetical protein
MGWIQDPEKTYPGSRDQKRTGPGIQIRNTGPICIPVMYCIVTMSNGSQERADWDCSGLAKPITKRISEQHVSKQSEKKTKM